MRMLIKCDPLAETSRSSVKQNNPTSKYSILISNAYVLVTFIIFFDWFEREKNKNVDVECNGRFYTPEPYSKQS